MVCLTRSQLAAAKTLIFREGRLLERQLYRYIFEDGTHQACLNALLAYQNPDGGFGNGIEPDLLCPASSAIGAETALFILDMIEAPAAEIEKTIIEPLLAWLVQNQTASGSIMHPPAGFDEYPYQPWWNDSDDKRVLSIAAQLRHWQDKKPSFFAKAHQFYAQQPPLETLGYYSYPTFLYLAHFRKTDQDETAFQALLAKIPSVLDNNANHFPLFSRAWYPLKSFMEPSVVEQGTITAVHAFLPAGGIANPYPNLPWWRSLFTLDVLMLLKKEGCV
jgi:hypothetical protein